MNEVQRLHERFCDYSLAFKGNTPQTIRWLKEAMKYLLRHTKAENLEQLTKRSIEDWIFWGKSEKDWAARTIRNRLGALSLFFDWCVNEEYIEKSPMEKIVRPRVPKRIPKHLTKDDAMELIEWVRNYRYYYSFERKRAVAIIATFIFTGIRRGELLNLKVQDINFKERTLFVDSGKGQKDRLIPLNLRLIEYLEDYLKTRDKQKRVCPYFFSSLRHDIAMGERALGRLVQKIKEKSKIYFYPHLLRHTFAVLMLEGGCDLFSLSKMLGHSDIKTTTIYLSATVTHLQEQIWKHPLG